MDLAYSSTGSKRFNLRSLVGSIKGVTVLLGERSSLKVAQAPRGRRVLTLLKKRRGQIRRRIGQAKSRVVRVVRLPTLRALKAACTLNQE